MRKDVQKFMLENSNSEVKMNYSALARKFDCDVRTVKKYMQNPSKAKKTSRKPRQVVSKLKKYEPIIIEKYENYSSTAMSIYGFIKTLGYKGSYSLVKQFLSKYKKTQCSKAIIRFETFPGIQAQVDWKENKTMITNSGKVITFNIFVIVLGYSRKRYFQITESRSQPVLFDCLINAFKFFGGVPKEILFDNMKTVVNKNKSFIGKLELNSKFEQFANDMGFKILACRPYNPQTKGKVEASVRLSNRLDAYNKEFETFEDLEKITQHINLEVNEQISQATLESANSRFEREKTKLLPLPLDNILFSYKHPLTIYKVSRESSISFKGKKYYIDPFYIGKKVEVFQQSDSSIALYYDSQFIQSHIVSNKIHNATTDIMIKIYESKYSNELSNVDIEKKAKEALASFDCLT